MHEKKAWEVAQAPFKNLLMIGFMMWMAGSTVHLFSIGITFSALWQPVSALQNVGKGTIMEFDFIEWMLNELTWWILIAWNSYFIIIHRNVGFAS